MIKKLIIRHRRTYTHVGGESCKEVSVRDYHVQYCVCGMSQNYHVFCMLNRLIREYYAFDCYLLWLIPDA